MEKTTIRFPETLNSTSENKSWVRDLLLVLGGAALLLMTLLSACASKETRVEFVTTQWINDKPVTAVRLSEPVRQKVYYNTGDGTWELSANELEVSAGWYLVAPPPPTTKEK